ncbi:hypothetical protein PFICI_11409 [Pestalotiopsis fici W106-1]|uniref:CID domain-containing protein n=1 Tax=Pestalotiopsis fici (strain W106-1 / CGMCC3.15140) TaxID=1229662 RepID=W3WUL4_PESFW|nr:uncharacterized protein PFICI_11409 [Pestalotiopsis fici W106-1]ETS77535.1 hypothetical protein PFICI_11409 [Pestalotiopsis fici W106-1]
MSSPVADLESGLNVMLGNKPPGVSGSQIKNITALCVNNVQSESVLIQKIFTHFKKTPGTHKLGVLYVVDSVTRRWIDQAKQQNQTINSSAPDGTYAAGVHRVTELIPVLMNDILQSAPEDQKEKIKKLVDIWEKGQTFPATLIESFKQKLNAPKSKLSSVLLGDTQRDIFIVAHVDRLSNLCGLPADESTTPIGSPPPGPGLPGLPGFNVAAANDKPAAFGAPSDIMEALKKIAQQNSSVAPSNSAVPALTPASDSYYVRSASAQQNGAAQQQPPPLPVTQSQPSFPFSAAPPPSVNPAMPFAYPPSAPAPAHVPAYPVTASSQPGGFPGIAAIPPPVPGVDPAAAQQVQLIQLLAQQGIPAENIPALLAAFQTNVPPVTQSAPIPAAPAGPLPYSNSWGQDQSRSDMSQNRNYGGRSPNRYQNRSRSRSPTRHWGSRDSPRGRSDRGHGGYGRDSPAHGRDDRSGWGGDYRQRSPPGRRGRSSSPQRFDQPQPGQKWVEFDRSLPSGHIKVLSRTLFVGGVTCSEAELRSMFNRSGQVQTCIVNKDKRHAFVKMVTRKDAVAAKEAMENSQYRTRWGVGFGPRDCSDYSSGISIIPINKLTEADRKWMLTAEWGGSGGRSIESGMVVEEPDIEIGAGVSSKAISRRMQTDRGGKHGPKSSRGDDEENLGRWRRNKENNPRREDQRGDNREFGNSQQPMVPDFPYGIPTGNNGMPIFPPGFAFPMPPSQ